MGYINSMKKLLAILLCLIFSQPCWAGIPGANYQPTAGVQTTGTLPVNCGGTAGTTGTAAINNLITGSPSSNNALIYNGTNWVPASVFSNYFGTGADGAVTISTSTNLTSTTDGPAIVKNYTSLTINSGQTLTVSNRCKGLIIYVQGNCTINGSLLMTWRGASAAGASTNVVEYTPQTDGITPGEGPITTTTFNTPAAGAAGGAGGATSNPGVAGTAGSLGQPGGGGGGGGDGQGTGHPGGNGTAGTSYSGGSGGGGAASINNGNVASTNGGTGGVGGAGGVSNEGGGGGAGNPGGAGGTGTPVGGSTGSSGSGGYLVLIVGGNLTIGSGAFIAANGSAGGNGGSGSGVGGSGGGGAGGGVIWIFYQGTLSNSGTVQALGGTAGTGGTGAFAGEAGGAGGAGYTSINQIL